MAGPPRTSSRRGPGSATYTATSTETAPPSTGLVAAYGFDEGSGATVADASGTGNAGTITGASRTAGTYGGALSFNGVSDWVMVPDANRLDLTRFTISAWVRPTSTQSGWRTPVLKEKAWELAYALYAHGVSPSAPAVWIDTGAEIGTGNGPTALLVGQWSYLTGSYDGSPLRLYVDGVLQATKNTTGTIGAHQRPPAHRRQRRLDGMVQRRPGRDTHLQPRPHRRRDQPQASMPIS